MSLAQAFAQVAPFYNLGLGIIALCLFIALFRIKTKVDLTPWKILFAAFLIYAVEEIFTILRKTDILYTPKFLNGFYELAIISLFIFMLLRQKKALE